MRATTNEGIARIKRTVHSHSTIAFYNIKSHNSPVTRADTLPIILIHVRRSLFRHRLEWVDVVAWLLAEKSSSMNNAWLIWLEAIFRRPNHSTISIYIQPCLRVNSHVPACLSQAAQAEDSMQYTLHSTPNAISRSLN